MLLIVWHVDRGWSLSWKSRIWRCLIQKATIWRKRLLSESPLWEENKSVSNFLCLSFCLLWTHKLLYNYSFSLCLCFCLVSLSKLLSCSLPQVWMWSKAKFVNRKFLMEELYQQHQAEQSGSSVSKWNECCSCFRKHSQRIFTNQQECIICFCFSCPFFSLVGN